MAGKKKTNKYFLSFVEEIIQNPDYFGYVGGRIEIWVDDEPYDIDEYRFFTKKLVEFDKFRNEYDSTECDKKQLAEIKKYVEENFHERT